MLLLQDYPPISLCTVMYKIGSKVLVNRKCPILNEIISPIQSAFIQHRGISDNMMLAAELIDTVRKKKGRGFFWLLFNSTCPKLTTELIGRFCKRCLSKWISHHTR